MKRGKSCKKDLIQYRLESAREMLHDARLLKENGGSPISIVNRAYYSVFYAALALLATADVEPIKHTFDNGIGIFNAPALPIQGDQIGGRQTLGIQLIAQITIPCTTITHFDQTY